MAVKIRLARIGKKSTPFYRIVAIDARQKRNGEYLENIGTYDGLHGKLVQFHKDLYENWLSKGAIPTESAQKLYKLYKKNSAAGTISSSIAEKTV